MRTVFGQTSPIIKHIYVWSTVPEGKAMSTIETITTILNDNLDIPEEKVTEDATFESLGIDSLDMAELTCTLEEELDIDLGEPEDLTTVGELVEYIDNL